MSKVVAIGERPRLEGYALAGVEILEAPDAAAAERMWEQLPADVGLLLLSPTAEAALAERLTEKQLLWVVVPA
jgi:vacuolar-type H+-ATPase subunit F/Vma7